MGAKMKLAFRDLTDAAKGKARSRLLCEIEKSPWQERVIDGFVAEAGKVGISVIPESVRFSKDGASFSASAIAIPLLLDQSGIGKKYLSRPEDFALFCACAAAEVRQIYPDSADIRSVAVSVGFDSFDNNDDGRALAVCDIAAHYLEQFLKRLVVTLSVRLLALLSAEHERIVSRNFLDGILETMGLAFRENGNWDSALFSSET